MEQALEKTTSLEEMKTVSKGDFYSKDLKSTSTRDNSLEE